MYKATGTGVLCIIIAQNVSSVLQTCSLERLVFRIDATVVYFAIYRRLNDDCNL